ncbi:hypothetical protein Q7P35_006687 [Cladosporium inversicolor]
MDASKASNNVDNLTDRAHINTTTKLTTMARDSGHSALGRYGLRPRPSTNSSQAVVHSTRQQNRSSRSRRAMINSTSPTPPSLPTLQAARIPYLPPEIVCMILRHHCIHKEAITLLLTRELAEEEAAFTERMSRLPPTILWDAPGHRSMVSFKPSTTKMLITPPHQFHIKPEINLLLTSKLFHDQFTKQFYSQNIFTFLGGDHVMVWANMSESKRAHVQHIQLESLWELDINFLGADNSNQPKKAFFTVKPI